MHEISPSNGYISQDCDMHAASQFLPHIRIRSSDAIGIGSESLEDLTFPENTFGIVAMQDIFKNVFNPDLAIKEVNRVLKSGGVHIFETPRFHALASSMQRARLLPSGEVEYLSSPEYHGNPVGDGQALVTWLFERDVGHLVNLWSGEPGTMYSRSERSFRIDAMLDEVFVIWRSNPG